MKGHFSIEWLSQSSQAASKFDPKAEGPSWHAADLGLPCTSGTLPESLPGFYSNRGAGNTEPQQRPTNQQQDCVNGSPAAQDPEPVFVSLSNPSSTEEAGFGSSTEEEETSGYESEGGRSLSPVASQDPPQVSQAGGRRPRTAFTIEQINQLEKAFKRNAYLGTHDKAELCKKLNLSDKQIRNWFQNRRMKLKRTLQDTLAHACQAKISSQLMQYPQLQAFGPAPHPGYFPVQESPSPYPAPLGLHYIPSPVGGAVPAINPDSLYHHYNGLAGLFTPAGSGALMQPHRLYPSHY